jgi:hypothetical protein
LALALLLLLSRSLERAARGNTVTIARRQGEQHKKDLGARARSALSLSLSLSLLLSFSQRLGHARYANNGHTVSCYGPKSPQPQAVMGHGAPKRQKSGCGKQGMECHASNKQLLHRNHLQKSLTNFIWRGVIRVTHSVSLYKPHASS